MRPLLACQCLRLAERHRYTSTYTGIITFYCTSESGPKLLDKESLNYCLMIKGFTALSSPVWPIHHPLTSSILPLHLISSLFCVFLLSPFPFLFFSSLLFLSLSSSSHLLCCMHSSDLMCMCCINFSVRDEVVSVVCFLCFHYKVISSFESRSPLLLGFHYQSFLAEISPALQQLCKFLTDTRPKCITLLHRHTHTVIKPWIFCVILISGC